MAREEAHAPDRTAILYLRPVTKRASLVFREAAELPAYQGVELGLATYFTLDAKEFLAVFQCPNVFSETRVINHAASPISYRAGR